MNAQSSSSGDPPHPPKKTSSGCPDGEEGPEEIKRLLQIFVLFGWVDPDDLAKALEAAALDSEKALNLLLEAGTVTADQVAYLREMDALTDYFPLAERDDISGNLS
jgi:hypothetical protein